MDIYVKPIKSVTLYGVSRVNVSDVASILAPKGFSQKVESLKVKSIEKSKKCKLVVSILDIISAIKNEFPDCHVFGTGENDCVVSWSPQKNNDKGAWYISKVVFISLLLFAGSITAIMSFQADAQMNGLFENVTRIIAGKDASTNIVEISYAIGIGAGILIFFNHVLGKRITDDPTPIQVEMIIYEDSVADTVIDVDSSNRLKSGEVTAL